MKNNNTMAVVLSFVLSSCAYQDAGGGIKAWISCDGWISSTALQSGQLFWQSKFILARRNVDLHYAIMMLLAQEDQTCLSKLPSWLITIWFQYQIFEVWVHRSETTGCSLKSCSLSLSLHTGVWFLKGFFISRITWSFSICWECQRGDGSLRAVLPSTRLQDSSTQLPWGPVFTNTKIRFVLQLPVSKTCIASKHWWQLKELCGLWAPPTTPPPPHPTPPQPVNLHWKKAVSQQKVPDSGVPRLAESPAWTPKVWINGSFKTNESVLGGRSNVEPQADPWTLAPDPFIPSSGVLILLKSSIWAVGDGPEEDQADSTNTAGPSSHELELQPPRSTHVSRCAAPRRGGIPGKFRLCPPCLGSSETTVHCGRCALPTDLMHACMHACVSFDTGPHRSTVGDLCKHFK